MKKNHVHFILQAHLPFVRHLDYTKFLEEDWLFESLAESYLPLLRAFRRLRADGVPFKITVSLSPTLCAMFDDEPLRQRFLSYLDAHRELGRKEIERCEAEQPECLALARMYSDMYEQAYSDYTALYQYDVLEGFRNLEESGHIEIITTAATHAYLPLYAEFPTAIYAQVETAVQSYIRHFKKSPKGFWLPECGYVPGFEEYLRRQGISWFPVASSAVALSDTPAFRGQFAPVMTPGSVAAFPLNYNLTSLVWSNKEGYPGDPEYREFYRDIGYDLPLDYIRPYIHEPDVRVFTGFKYWAVTGRTDQKKVYVPQKAYEKVQKHADNFLYEIRRTGQDIDPLMDIEPSHTIAFDAELFGHWWFEGVDWLEAVIRKASSFSDISFDSPPDVLPAAEDSLQTLTPGFSSWGAGGYSSVWLDGENSWMYRHIHMAIKRMEEMAVRFPDQTSLRQRCLNQAARELLLAMASDWPFIIHNKTSIEYPEKRVKEHLENFTAVYDNMARNAVNTEWLIKAEERDNIFPDMDYNIFIPQQQ